MCVGEEGHQNTDHAEVFTASGYFRSGDLGYKNNKKQLYISGRSKESQTRRRKTKSFGLLNLKKLPLYPLPFS